MKKIFKIILSMVLALSIISVIVIMVSATMSIKNNEPAYIFGYALGVVPTDSMVGDNPDSLDVNDMYFMRKTTIDDISVGDVVVYQGVAGNGADILIVHRVIDETSEGFVTQGDNEAYADQEGIQDYITSENLVGKYQTKITFLKPISALVQSNRSVIFLALIAVISILLITEIIEIIKSVNKNKQQQMQEAHDEELKALKESMKKEVLDELKVSTKS